MAKQEAYKGVFAGMDFPGYEYQHYPLMLTKGSGKVANEQLIVNDAGEEKAALAEGWIAPKRVGPPVSLTQKELDVKDAELADLKEQLRRAKMTPEARAAEDKAKAPRR